MRMPDPFVTELSAGKSVVRRKCAACDADAATLRAKSAETPHHAAGEYTPAATGSVLGVLSAPGEPLGATTRAFFEPRFGRDFGAVRIHTGEDATRSPRSIGAMAYTLGSWGEVGTVDLETGAQTVTSTCCPSLEGQPVSSPDKFSVIDAGARPVAGGTNASYRFEYIGATDSTGDCACNCCAFVQFVKGFFEVNGVRKAHTLPGSGAALSPTTMGQDSPIIPHAGCRVATAGGGPLSDTPGIGGIAATDNLNIHLRV